MPSTKSWIAAFIVALIAQTYIRSGPIDKVQVSENGYFGTGTPRKDDPKIVPFKIEVPEEVLQDLKNRLKSARIGHSQLEDANDFYYGFNKVKEYWLTEYDWRKSEAIFNSFPNFKTQIEGLQVHFIHSKAAPGYKKVFPVLVVHGWPGSVYEFHKFIPILNNPKKHGINVDFAFDVVAPSIPGYGWSEQPRKTGFSQLAAARVFRKLMERLGHKKFYCQAGDWGAVITKMITAAWPERKFTNDELLTMVMVYWVNQNIATSQRFYREFFLDNTMRELSSKYIKVPTGHASGIHEMYDGLPIEISRYYFNITHHVEIDMGHFAAMEAPQELAMSFFTFVKDLL